jgi:hypothetical protein
MVVNITPCAERIKLEVYEVLGEVAELFNVPTGVYRNRLPVITVDGRARNTHYDRKNNVITLKPEHVGKRGAYAEENTHFLRNVYFRESDIIAQEFIGGLARLIVVGGDITLDGQQVKVQECTADIEKALMAGQKSMLEIQKATRRPLDKHQLALMDQLAGELEQEDKDMGGTVSERSIGWAIRDDMEESRIDTEISRIELGKLELELTIYNTRAHEEAYKMAQRIYNGGVARELLGKHPDIIRYPDSKVLRTAREYSRKARARKIGNSTAF